MGSPVSGRVAYFCALDRNEGFFRPSILRYFAMGVTLWVECGFPLSRSKRSFLWITGRYSFRMGSPFSGQILTIWSQLKEFLQLGSWEWFFRLVLGWFFVILGSSGWLWSRGGVFHIQLSSLPVRTLCVSLLPMKEWVLALLLLALLPLAIPSWVGLLWQSSGVSFTRAFFHARVFRAWWLTSDSPGSRASQEVVLACIQGASDSLRHPSPGGETKTSAFGIAVRVLLRAMSLSHCMVSSLVTGRGLSISALKGCISAPFGFLVLMCWVLPFSWVITLSA